MGDMISRVLGRQEKCDSLTLEEVYQLIRQVLEENTKLKVKNAELEVKISKLWEIIKK